MNFQRLQSVSPSSLFSRSLRLGVLGIGVAAFWIWTSRGSVLPLWVFRRQKKQLPSSEMKAKLIDLLDELCAEFHQIFSELAQMVISVQRTVSNRGLADALPQEQMEAILMQQGFQLRLQTAEAKVLASAGWTKSDLDSSSKQFASDVDVALRVEGLSTMYSDAIKGRLPLLPGVEIPEQLKSQGAMLEILAEIQQRKIELFDAIFQTATSNELSPKSSSAGSLPSPQLNAQLTSAAERAEREILERHSDIVESKKLYHHSLAFHSTNEEFKRKKAIMDELHSDRVVEVMKKGLNKSKAPVLVILHDRLEHVKSDDLSLLIESAEETNRPSICLITKKTNDSIGMSLLENFSTELTSLEKCHGKGILEKASFLFTEYDEYSKSKFEGAPKLLETELPLYILFDGSKFQKIANTLVDALEFVKLSLESAKVSEDVKISDEVEIVLSTEVAPDLQTTLGVIENATDDVSKSSAPKVSTEVPAEVHPIEISTTTIEPPPEIPSQTKHEAQDRKMVNEIDEEGNVEEKDNSSDVMNVKENEQTNDKLNEKDSKVEFTSSTTGGSSPVSCDE